MTLVNDQNEKAFSIGVGQKIIVDSGTSFLLMPEDDRAKFMHQLEKNSGLYCEDGPLPVCFCSESEYQTSFPDLNFTISGVNYYVPKEQYVFQSTYLY